MPGARFLLIHSGLHRRLVGNAQFFYLPRANISRMWEYVCSLVRWDKHGRICLAVGTRFKRRQRATFVPCLRIFCVVETSTRKFLDRRRFDIARQYSVYSWKVHSSREIPVENRHKLIGELKILETTIGAIPSFVLNIIVPSSRFDASRVLFNQRRNVSRNFSVERNPEISKFRMRVPAF